VVNLDDILTIRKSRLEDRITLLGEEEMRLVARAINFALDLWEES
jgi:mRNA-degrading endonuclease toxin of MazEF toxin-antitoxin module